MLKISQTWLRCRNVYLWDKIWVGIRIWKYKCAEVCSGLETGHEIPKFEQSNIYTYWTRKESSIPYKYEKVRDFTSDPLHYQSMRKMLHKIQCFVSIALRKFCILICMKLFCGKYATAHVTKSWYQFAKRQC